MADPVCLFAPFPDTMACRQVMAHIRIIVAQGLLADHRKNLGPNPTFEERVKFQEEEAKTHREVQRARVHLLQLTPQELSDVERRAEEALSAMWEAKRGSGVQDL